MARTNTHFFAVLVVSAAVLVSGVPLPQTSLLSTPSLRMRPNNLSPSSWRSGTNFKGFAEAKCVTETEFEDAVKRFSQLLKYRTVSSPTKPLHVLDDIQFQRMDVFFSKAYKEVWSNMTIEKVGAGNLSYLLTWPGSNPSAPAALFISHVDVVPVAEETLANWTYPPFSGTVADGYIWGRGALDVKVGVAGLLEAATLLIREGFQPQRTLMFAFGQDEEVGGEFGAGVTAQLLADRNVTLDIILDEGGSIGRDGFPPFMDQPLALVGTAEKGFASIDIEVGSAGGHSSLPPIDHTSLGAVVGRILSAIDVNPPPTALRQPVTEFLKTIAPYTDGWLGGLFSVCDFPFIERLVQLIMAGSGPETAALVRTTAAVTGLQAGVAENVLPPAGSVRVNFRLLPGTREADLFQYLKKVIGGDMMFVTSIKYSRGQNATLATPVTSAATPYFALLRQALQEVYTSSDYTSTVEVTPYLMPGGTDSKHYLRLSRQGALRHVPVSLDKSAGDLRRIHGLNERVAIGDFGRAICVYKRALELFSQL